MALVLGLSRWGTNIGVSPLYIGDILIAAAIVHAIVARMNRIESPTTELPRGRTSGLFCVFFLYFGVRWVASIGQGTILEWMRDGVPFAYGALALLSAYSLARSPRTTRDRTFRLFRWALTIHIIWMALAGLSGNSDGFDILGPLSEANVFQIRPDIDAALMSIAAAINLRQMILGRRRGWNALGILLAVGVVFAVSHSRAGQISMLVTIALAYALTYAASRHLKGRQLLMIFALPLILAAILIVVPQTLAGQRMIATIVPDTQSAVSSNAQGTERARQLTWSETIEWVNEDPGRVAVGSGFGNNFLEQAGTLSYLEGTTYENVRSPHNWFVGIYARMGFIGIVLAILWVLQTIILIFKQRQSTGNDDLLALSCLIFVALLPVATFGVILEAPFGAIPFFWASGIIAGSWINSRESQKSARQLSS